MVDAFKFELGNTLKDTVTGFEGIVIGRRDWLDEATDYYLQPKVKEPHVLPQAEWITEGRLEKVVPTKSLMGGDDLA